MGKKLSDDLEIIANKINKFSKEELPEKIRNLAQENIDQSFEKEQYQDGKSSKWEGRKNEGESSRTERRAILVKSAELIQSTEATIEGSTIVIGSDTKYAQRHNEGLKDMPKRQFMPIEGEAPPFENDIEQFIDDAMDEIFG